MMFRSGTRRKAGRALRVQAFCAYKRFAKQNLEIGEIHFRQFEINHGAPVRRQPHGARDIILAGCLINYYAE